MRDKIFKFTVALRNYEDMYYREMCVQSKLPIKEFCYIILASFEALANDRLFVDEAKQPTMYIYDNLNLNDISKDVVECLSIYDFNTLSRLISLTNLTSIPDSSIFEGIRSIPSSVLKRANPDLYSISSTILSITFASVESSSSGFLTPNESVRLPCGSASINKTFLPCRTSPAPKFAAVVVLPTPPF